MLGAPNLPDLPGVSTGPPITGNVLSAAGEGRLEYSIGPGMLFNALNLNPSDIPL